MFSNYFSWVIVLICVFLTQTESQRTIVSYCMTNRKQKWNREFLENIFYLYIQIFYLVAVMILFILVLKNEGYHKCFVFILDSQSTELPNTLWTVILLDCTLKFGSLSLKTFLISISDKIWPMRSRIIVLKFITNIFYFYRSTLPFRLWMSFFFKSGTGTDYFLLCIYCIVKVNINYV